MAGHSPLFVRPERRQSSGLKQKIDRFRQQRLNAAVLCHCKMAQLQGQRVHGRGLEAGDGAGIWNYVQADTLKAIYWLMVTVIVWRWVNFQADWSRNLLDLQERRKSLSGGRLVPRSAVRPPVNDATNDSDNGDATV